MRVERHIKYTILYLITVILIDFMGMATVVVLFPKLLLTSSGIFPEQWTAQTKIMLMGIFLAIYPLGQIIGASSLGKLSDYYGRKKLLLVTLLGTCIGFSLSGIAIAFKAPLLLFISRLLAGLSAGNVAIAQASLMDISTPETKTKNIAYSQMAMGSAYIVGPIVGGLLSQPSIVSWFDMSTPFWLFSIIIIALFIVTVKFYDETLSHPKKEKMQLLESVHQLYQAITSHTLGKAFSIWLLFVSGWWLFESFMPAFLLQRFHFDTTQIGYILAFNGALYTSFQYVVIQRVSKIMSPINMVRYSAIIVGFSIIAIAFITNTAQLYLAMSIFVMAMGFSIPGLITHISNLAGKADQGQVMGMINSVQAISTVLVMLLGGYLNSIHPDSTVIGGGILIVISWLIFIGQFPGKYQPKCDLEKI